MVQRAIPPVSRRMPSTPPSMSVKLVRLEKKFLTACKGAWTSIFPLNDERTRNISQLAVSCKLYAVRIIDIGPLDHCGRAAGLFKPATGTPAMSGFAFVERIVR